MKVTKKILRDRYDYLPCGTFVLKRFNRAVRGCDNGNGYLSMGVTIDGRLFTMKYHRAIWLWHHGYLPEMLDHINRNRTDNRIENLRPCTRSQNFANMQAHKFKHHGLPKGVHKNSSGFCARITHNRKNHYLGQFKNPEDAGRAYDDKAKELFGDFASRNS